MLSNFFTANEKKSRQCTSTGGFHEMSWRHECQIDHPCAKLRSPARHQPYFRRSPHTPYINNSPSSTKAHCESVGTANGVPSVAELTCS